MISWPLFKRNMINMGKPFAIILAVLCLYTCVIIYMFDPKFADMFEQYQEAMPEMMAAVGMTGAASNLLEWIQIYLYGFIMLLFPLIFIIILNHGLITRYIDDGSMACLLATPNSRGKIIRTQMISAVFGISLLMATIIAIGIGYSELQFPGELDISRYLILGGNTLLFQLVVAGIGFVSACFTSDSRWFYTLGAGIPLAFYIINAMANMGGDLDKLKYFTIYTLLPTADFVAGKEEMWVYTAILAIIAVILYFTGYMRFKTRDLSL